MHIINLKNSDTHRTEDRVVDGAFCSCTDDGSESRCVGMLQLILLVISQCALVPEIAAPESISHGGDCRVDVAMYTVRGMNMLV